MRKDIFDIVRTSIMKSIKPNFSSIARQYNCDPRTVKRYYLNGNTALTRKARIYKRIIDPYTDLIIEKLSDGASAKAIHNFLKSKGIKIGYSTIKSFCHKHKTEQQKAAVLRFETNPGLQAQVDWKEDFKLMSKDGKVYIINIFLVVLGYSRYKFFKLTTDRNQSTVFKGLLESFRYFGGVPKEILFDNMRTVVDQSRTQFGKPVYNERFYEFTKDAGFIPRSCMAYRPQTKGKVESAAHLIDRMKVFNREFNNLEELELLVQRFNKEINAEVSQALGVSPQEKFKGEQKYLNPLPNQDVFEDYFDLRPNKRKVSTDSMICVHGNKYSVPVKYINTNVFYQIENDILEIFDSTHISICKHNLTTKKYNYLENHYREIASTVISDPDAVEKVCKSNLSLYDRIKG